MARSRSSRDLDLDELDAAVAHGVVVAEPVRFLDDDLALHRAEIRQVDHLLPVAAGEHGGGAERQRRGGAAGHHRRFGFDQRREALADLVVQLVEHHVMLRRVVDRVHHLGRHQRRGHRRVGAGRVDEGTDAQFLEVVLRGHRCLSLGRMRPYQAPHHRQRRYAFEKTSPAPHLPPPGDLPPTCSDRCTIMHVEGEGNATHADRCRVTCRMGFPALPLLAASSSRQRLGGRFGFAA